MVLFLLSYSSSHGPLRPPTSRPRHASGPLTHSSRSRPHAATPVTCPAHVPPMGPPPMLYTTGPAHPRRPTSRRTRPLTRSRSRPTRMRSRPLHGPARTRSPRRSHNPCCPLTRPMVALSHRHLHTHPRRSPHASPTARPARPEPAPRQRDHPPPYISPGFVAYWPSRGSYSGFVAYWPFRLSPGHRAALPGDPL